MPRNNIKEGMCRNCYVHHPRNCEICSGFGFHEDGKSPLSGESAMTIFNEEGRLMIRQTNWCECPECHGTPFGVKELQRAKFRTERHF